jgi:hypothetical protein
MLEKMVYSTSQDGSDSDTSPKMRKSSPLWLIKLSLSHLIQRLNTNMVMKFVGLMNKLRILTREMGLHRICQGHHTKVSPPVGYRKIRVHLVYDLKHDSQHKARLVADGHLTDIPLDSVYYGVVSLQGF